MLSIVFEIRVNICVNNHFLMLWRLRVKYARLWCSHCWPQCQAELTCVCKCACACRQSYFNGGSPTCLVSSSSHAPGPMALGYLLAAVCPFPHLNVWRIIQCHSSGISNYARTVFSAHAQHQEEDSRPHACQTVALTYDSSLGPRLLFLYWQ